MGDYKVLDRLDMLAPTRIVLRCGLLITLVGMSLLACGGD